MGDTRIAAGVIALALAAAGCGGAHQCVIPSRPLAPTASRPLPVHVGVAYAPALPERSEHLQIGDSSWDLPVGPAAVAAFNQAAVQLFERASDGSGPLPEQGGPDALLHVDLAPVRYAAGPFHPERAAVHATAVLTDRAGAELARASADEAADGSPVHQMGLFHCDALGSALSQALAAAAGRIRDDLAASPRLREWVRERGAAASATATSTPTPTSTSTSTAISTATATATATSNPSAASSSPPLPAPEQPAEKTRWVRPWALPRFMGGEIVSGTVSSSSPGIGSRSGTGWGVYWAWDLGEWLDLEMRGGVANIRVGWTPDPSVTDSGAENGFFGAGLRARLLPGRAVCPWVSIDLAYQAVTWSSYFHTVGAWAPIFAIGVDVAPVSWGAVRLGASYSAFTATVSALDGTSGPGPQPTDPGSSASMRTWWLSAGWVFDLGPPAR